METEISERDKVQAEIAFQLATEYTKGVIDEKEFFDKLENLGFMNP